MPKTEPSINDIPEPELTDEEIEALEELKAERFKENLKRYEYSRIRERT